MRKLLFLLLSVTLLTGCADPAHDKEVPHRNVELREHACQIHLCED